MAPRRDDSVTEEWLPAVGRWPHMLGRVLIVPIGAACCACAAERPAAVRSHPPVSVVVEHAASPGASSTPERLPDDALVAWLRDGCGPVETASEQSALATIDPALAKVPAIAETFPNAKGTIVHARGGELWIVSADGKRRRRLKRASMPTDPPTAASWSPTGNALVFVTHHGDERGRLVMLGARCESARVLGPATDFDHPTFSADGQFIVSRTHRIDLASGERTTIATNCNGSLSPDGKRCLVEDPSHAGALHVTEPGTENAVDVAPPRRGAFEVSELADIAWTRDGSTLWIVPRFRGTEVVAGAVTLYDWSPLYRVALPKALSPTKSKQVEPVYFLPGSTSVRRASFTLSPDESSALWLQEHVPGAVYAASLADVYWLRLSKKKGAYLGTHHKLVGLNSWIHGAQWSPDGKSALLTIELCHAGRAIDDFDPCAQPSFEFVLADEKRAGFVGSGRLASWTRFDAF